MRCDTLKMKICVEIETAILREPLDWASPPSQQGMKRSLLEWRTNAAIYEKL